MKSRSSSPQTSPQPVARKSRVVSPSPLATCTYHSLLRGSLPDVVALFDMPQQSSYFTRCDLDFDVDVSILHSAAAESAKVQSANRRPVASDYEWLPAHELADHRKHELTRTLTFESDSDSKWRSKAVIRTSAVGLTSRQYEKRSNNHNELRELELSRRPCHHLGKERPRDRTLDVRK